MEDIKFPEKVQEIKDEIERIETEIPHLKEQLEETYELSKRYEILWKLKEEYENVKENYRSLEIWSDENQSDKYLHYLCLEIYHFEICLNMLKEKHGTSKIDLRYFLNASRLEYYYFVVEDKELPDKFLENNFQLYGDFEDKRINLIVNNIFNAQNIGFPFLSLPQIGRKPIQEPFQLLMSAYTRIFSPFQ